MSILEKLGLQDTFTILRNGQYIEIPVNILEFFNKEDERKTVIHKNLGDTDTFEFLGNGSHEITFPLIFKNKDEFEEFNDFVKNPKPFIIASNITDLDTYYSFVKFSNYKIDYQNFINVDFLITNAKNVLQKSDETDTLTLLFLLSNKRNGSGGKKNFLAKLKDFAKKTSDFIGNVNEAVSKITNTIAEYSETFSSIANGIASASTIVTNPINSVKNSFDMINGGIGAIINGFSNAISTITSLPGDVENFFSQLIQTSLSIKDLFKSGIKDSDLQETTLFLQSVADNLVEIDFNENIIGDSFNNEVLRQNNDVFKCVILSGVLSGIYDQISDMSNWNTLELEKTRKTTEKVYNYIASRPFIDNDFKYELDLLRNNFFRSYKILYQNSNKIIEIDVLKPDSIFNIVYKVNGNFDFVDEAIQLNNVINTGFVAGKVKIITND